MSEYTPDRWVVIEIENDGVKHQRVFAGWYGGYLSGDSWKMNSGITKVVKDKKAYHFYGESGSVYHCYKKSYGMSGYMTTVLQNFQNQLTDSQKIELVDGYDPKK